MQKWVNLRYVYFLLVNEKTINSMPTVAEEYIQWLFMLENSRSWEAGKNYEWHYAIIFLPLISSQICFMGKKKNVVSLHPKSKEQKCWFERGWLSLGYSVLNKYLNKLNYLLFLLFETSVLGSFKILLFVSVLCVSVFKREVEMVFRFTEIKVKNCFLNSKYYRI